MPALDPWCLQTCLKPPDEAGECQLPGSCGAEVCALNCAQGPVTVHTSGAPMYAPGSAPAAFQQHQHGPGEIYAVYDNAQVQKLSVPCITILFIP